MEKLIKLCKNNFGLIVSAFGLGIIITVIAPFWAWILLVGASILGVGTYLFNKK